MQLQLTLHIDEVNKIIEILGQQPTASGVFPLMAKIQQLGSEQINLLQQQAAALAENGGSPEAAADDTKVASN